MNIAGRRDVAGASSMRIVPAMRSEQIRLRIWHGCNSHAARSDLPRGTAVEKSGQKRQSPAHAPGFASC